MGRWAGHSVVAVAGVAIWRAVLCSVVRLSSRPVFFDKDCLRLFRSLGRICVLDVHVGQTGVSTVILGDDPQRDFPRSPCRRVTWECCCHSRYPRW